MSEVLHSEDDQHVSQEEKPKLQFLSHNTVQTLANNLATTPPDWPRLMASYVKQGFPYETIPQEYAHIGIFFDLYVKHVIETSMNNSLDISHPPMPYGTKEYAFSRGENGEVVVRKKGPDGRRTYERSYDALLHISGEEGSILLAIESQAASDNRARRKNYRSDYVPVRRFLGATAMEKYVAPLQSYIAVYNRISPDSPIDRYGCMVVTTDNAEQVLRSSQNRMDFEKNGGIVVGMPISYEVFATRAIYIGTTFQELVAQRRGRVVADVNMRK